MAATVPTTDIASLVAANTNDDSSDSDSMIGQPLHLQFCPWLMQQISSGKFRDLEWLDKDRKRLFKIPWTKKYLPHWQEHHEIFRAWAEYRGLYDASTAPLCRMKSNFRTILRKCAVIEEVPNAHQLGLQTGNYKVYRVLTQKEAIQKRNQRRNIKVATAPKKRKKRTVVQKAPEESEPKAPESHASKNIVSNVNQVFQRHNLDNFPVIISSLPQQTVTIPALGNAGSAKVEIIIDEQSGQNNWLTLPTNIQISHTKPQNPLLNKPQVASADGEQAEDGNGSSHGFQMLLEAAQIAEENSSDPNVKSKTSASACSVSKPLRTITPKMGTPSVVDVLLELKIPPEELFMYEVHVKYETKTVLQDSLTDMKYGYRLFYGNAESRANKFQDLNCSTFDCTPVKLPDSQVPPGNSLYTVLKNMSPGLFLKSDQAHTLCGKRLCLSRIFAFTSYGAVNADSEALVMANNQETVLFSYKNFLNDWRQFLVDGSPQPNVEINFAFGKKPKQRHSRVFVSITLVPKAAKSMMEKITEIEINDGDSTCSQEGHFDNILCMFYS